MLISEIQLLTIIVIASAFILSMCITILVAFFKKS